MEAIDKLQYRAKKKVSLEDLISFSALKRAEGILHKESRDFGAFVRSYPTDSSEDFLNLFININFWVVEIYREKEKLDLEVPYGITLQYAAVRNELPYEDFVRLTYRLLEDYGKMPIDLTYDLLNEMARELYEAALGHQDEIEFHLEDRSRVGKELRDLRIALGIGQRELARTMGISQPDLGDIEHRKYVPSPIKIQKYLEGLRAAIQR